VVLAAVFDAAHAGGHLPARRAVCRPGSSVDAGLQSGICSVTADSPRLAE
jgi:hypothetical protein